MNSRLEPRRKIRGADRDAVCTTDAGLVDIKITPDQISNQDNSDWINKMASRNTQRTTTVKAVEALHNEPE